MSEPTFNFTQVLERVASIIQSRVQLQIPVKTGKLRDSFRVVVEDETLFYFYEDYGVFTNYGTGPYYNGRYGMPAEVGSFKGYVKGQGGIQAQNWSSLPIDTDALIQQMISEEFDRQVEQAFYDALYNG
jgi:hypothetical protein